MFNYIANTNTKAIYAFEFSIRFWIHLYTLIATIKRGRTFQKDFTPPENSPPLSFFLFGLLAEFSVGYCKLNRKNSRTFCGHCDNTGDDLIVQLLILVVLICRFGVYASLVPSQFILQLFPAPASVFHCQLVPFSWFLNLSFWSFYISIQLRCPCTPMYCCAHEHTPYLIFIIK